MHLGPWSRRRPPGILMLFMTAATSIIGCADLFSPSFLNIIDAGNGTSAFEAIDPPTGNIAIDFENRAQIQDEVFRYLIQGQLVVTPELVDEVRRFNAGRTEQATSDFLNQVLNNEPANFEEWNLPPRVRVIMDVTTRSGGVQRLQFLDGLLLVRGEDFVGDSGNITVLPPDLMQITNTVFLVQCPIDTITLVSIEVYVPVVVRLLETVLVGAPGNQVQIVQCQGQTPPRYELLQADEGFDSDLGNFLITRNYDPRMFPPPLTNLNCGPVVVLELGGDLTLPFRDIPAECNPPVNVPASGRAPAYFVDAVFDVIAAQVIPGRYDISLQIRDQ